MRPHPYLRAYMAGVAVPTPFLLVIMTVFTLCRSAFEAPSPFAAGPNGPPLERLIVFPMAVVPNAWGLWNMLHLAVRSRVRLSLGMHGAILPLALIPAGVVLARALGVFTVPWPTALPVVPIAMTVYYLAWKYLIGFLNREVAIL